MSGTTVFAGGSFTAIGGQTRNDLAALDATLNTNNATAWNPNANGAISALAVSGTTVYAGGIFTGIGGQMRNDIAALDATIDSSNATAWDPNANGSVTTLATGAGTVYAGGDFTSIGGQTRNRVAALSATLNTNDATSWNPVANGTLYALAVGGGAVYAGGSFGTIAGAFHPFFGGVSDGLVAVAEPPAAVLRGALVASPNPFRSFVDLRLELPLPDMIDVAVYDVAGRLERRLHRGMLAQGPHQFPWDGCDEFGRRSQAGLYFVRVDAGAWSTSAKVLRLR